MLFECVELFGGAQRIVMLSLQDKCGPCCTAETGTGLRATADSSDRRRTGLSIPTFKLYLSLLFIVQSSIKMANQSDILFKTNTNSALFSADTVSDSVNRGMSTASKMQASLYDWIVYQLRYKAREKERRKGRRVVRWACINILRGPPRRQW